MNEDRASSTSPRSADRRGPDPVVRRTNVGRLLIGAFERFEDRIISEFHDLGWDVRLSDTAILRNVDLDGTRIGTIAERARITPQAVSQHVVDLERRGFVERRPDPADGRARRVHLTERAREMIAAGQRINRRLDEEWSEILGPEGFAELRRMLREIVRRAPGRASESVVEERRPNGESKGDDR